MNLPSKVPAGNLHKNTYRFKSLYRKKNKLFQTETNKVTIFQKLSFIIKSEHLHFYYIAENLLDLDLLKDSFK